MVVSNLVFSKSSRSVIYFICPSPAENNFIFLLAFVGGGDILLATQLWLHGWDYLSS
jgi:hypothetical protein